VTFLDDCNIVVDLDVLTRDRHMRQELRDGSSLTVSLGAETFVVALVRKPWFFGGERVFIACPSCGRAARRLREGRGCDHRLACRACLQLRYRSQEKPRRIGSTIDHLLDPMETIPTP
jgi:hypothetical protein